ncbi:hypothetical protein B4102_3113 [Heyndrickxia sporothermodurans]|uniref:Uncharacterized protein n=1 Tax=Heyndrickxia sporothermodurans TaxID=46224 RepID=A0A150L0Y8_9BACI|nr:hypothetical protein [Heyndrickxia sporothermodurans]KYD05940.1 hypothetical protein B4102_3113 [Heyndrickxia sporothermodurans]
MNKKHYFKLIQFTILIYCLFFIVGKANTYAWFTSEIKASGKITNATTKDLLSISKKEVSYLKNCEISQVISIKNISNMEIPVQLENEQKILSPGESFLAKINQAVSCEKTEVSYHLTGLKNYIDEMIHEPLDQKKLLATVEKKEEQNKPIEKSKDKPNVNAEAKDHTEDLPGDKTKEDSQADSGKNVQDNVEVKKHSSDSNTNEPDEDEEPKDSKEQ